MRDFVKKHKSEIIVGVVVSIITALIMAFGNWLKETAPIIGSSALGTLTNIIYSTAATETNGNLILLIVSAILGISMGVTFFAFREEMRTFREALKIEHMVKTLSEDEAKDLDDYLRLKQLNETAQSEPETIKNIIDKHKHSGFKAILVLLLTVLWFISIVVGVFVPTHLRDEFERDIIIIHPYVEEHSILQLKSDWALMRSKEDYVSIYEYINMVKDENALTSRGK